MKLIKWFLALVDPNTESKMSAFENALVLVAGMLLFCLGTIIKHIPQ